MEFNTMKNLNFTTHCYSIHLDEINNIPVSKYHLINMKQLLLLTFAFILFGTACKSTETNSNIPSGPTTIAQFSEENPEKPEVHSWIPENERDNIWIYVDEFPDMLNGMRDLQQRISMTVTRNQSEDCDKLSGEQVIYSFVINENGNISKIMNSLQEPNECAELLEITIRATSFTPGKVDGKPVQTLYSLPVNF